MHTAQEEDARRPLDGQDQGPGGLDPWSPQGDCLSTIILSPIPGVSRQSRPLGKQSLNL